MKIYKIILWALWGGFVITLDGVRYYLMGAEIDIPSWLDYVIALPLIIWFYWTGIKLLNKED